jgi:hypothetical protein
MLIHLNRAPGPGAPKGPHPFPFFQNFKASFILISDLNHLQMTATPKNIYRQVTAKKTA